MGFKKVAALLGGNSAWYSAGLPVQAEAVEAEAVQTGDDHEFVEVARQDPENLPPPLLPRRSETPTPTPDVPIITPSRTDMTNAPRIAPAEAWELVQAGRAVMVDVRHKESFDVQRISGAKNLPIEELQNRARAELSPTRWIIPYCT